MEDPQYRKLQEEIRFCSKLNELERLVQRILAPTGFGSNSLADTDEPVALDYQEMAECLLETDRKFFEHEILLLHLAHRQVEIIGAGSVPEAPVPINPWEMLM